MRHLLVLLTFGATIACAQNFDLGVLGGFSGPEGQVSIGPGVKVSGSVGASTQLTSAFQIRSTDHGDVYVEVPVVWSWDSSAVVGSGVSSLSRRVMFLTPGMRFKLPLHSRIALYGAAGGGIGRYSADEAVLDGSNVRARSVRTTKPVLDLGGGLDFRLTRLLSIRAEGRDFVKGSGVVGFAGHHHGVFQFGVGLHF